MEQRDEGTRVNLDTSDALLIVSINQTYPRLSAYDAARYAWRVSPERANQVQYVVATKNRRVVGVFEPHDWRPATRANFPEFEREMRCEEERAPRALYWRQASASNCDGILYTYAR